MKSLWQLVRTYSMGAPWQAGLTIAGWTIFVAALFNIQSVAGSFALQGLCFAACGMIFAGTAMMPRMFGQLARTHAVQFLPWARSKLFVSAFLTVVLVAFPLPVLSVLVSRAGFSRFVLDPQNQGIDALVQFLTLPFLWNLVANVFLFCTFLYVTLWFVTNSRTALGKVLALIVAVALLSIPPRYVSLNPDAPIAPVVVAIVAYWLSFAAVLMLAPRLREHGDLKARIHRVFYLRATPSVDRRRALRLILGIANPWTLAGATACCIALDTLFVSAMGPWLFFLSILAIVVNAITALAAMRSRALWLRDPGSRDELFGSIERLLWRHSVLSLIVMAVWYIAVAIYWNVPAASLAFGIPLIGASAACSFYLGLMQTGGLRWADGMLAIATTLTIMGTALLIARADTEAAVILGLEFALFIGALAFRTIARQRWIALDWASCRPPLRLAAKQ